MKKKTNIFWGIALIVIGICYMGNLFWNWDFRIGAWWALIILLPCISNIISNGITVANLIGAMIGFMFLPPVKSLLDYQSIRKLILPAIFIIVGMILIIKELVYRQTIQKTVKKDDPFRQERKEKLKSEQYYATFSSNNVIYPNEEFIGAEISSNFGSVSLDLRNAIIIRDAVINCTVAFGGAEVFLPKGVNLRITGTPIFGGIDNKTHFEQNPNAPTVFFNATCIFGGVEIK